MMLNPERPDHLKELKDHREHLKGFEQGGDVIIYPCENIILAAECRLDCMKLTMEPRTPARGH